MLAIEHSGDKVFLIMIFGKEKKKKRGVFPAFRKLQLVALYFNHIGLCKIIINQKV